MFWFCDIDVTSASLHHVLWFNSLTIFISINGNLWSVTSQEGSRQDRRPDQSQVHGKHVTERFHTRKNKRSHSNWANGEHFYTFSKLGPNFSLTLTGVNIPADDHSTAWHQWSINRHQETKLVCLSGDYLYRVHVHHEHVLSTEY